MNKIPYEEEPENIIARKLRAVLEIAELHKIPTTVILSSFKYLIELSEEKNEKKNIE
jgi:hypothetical protein